MIPYQTNKNIISGTSYAEMKKIVNRLFKNIEKKTKRKPYILSAYFKKQKIFFDYFWIHLFEKNHKERVKRLRYFEAALYLIRHSRNHPTIEKRETNKKQIFYRFAGLTKNKELFYVQIKENKKTGSKYFMSCFADK